MLEFSTDNLLQIFMNILDGFCLNSALHIKYVKICGKYSQIIGITPGQKKISEKSLKKHLKFAGDCCKI